MTASPTTVPARPKQSFMRLITHVVRMVVWRGTPLDLQISGSSVFALAVLSTLVGVLLRSGLPGVSLARALLHATGEIAITFLLVGALLKLMHLSERLPAVLGSVLLVSIFADLTFFAARPIALTIAGSVIAMVLMLAQGSAFVHIPTIHLERQASACGALPVRVRVPCRLLLRHLR